jgi:hypothetical protein
MLISPALDEDEKIGANDTEFGVKGGKSSSHLIRLVTKTGERK